MGQNAQNLFAQNKIDLIVGAPEEAPEEIVPLFLEGKLVTGDNTCDHQERLRMANKKSAAFGSVLNPKTPLLVSCRGKDGRNNALVVVYACNCSYDPPMVMVGVVPLRYSYGIIKETGVFIANLVPESMREAFDYLGSHSGRDEDKLVKLGLRLGEGVKVAAPILLDCPVSIECRVVDSIRTGSHEMFVGKVEYVHADEGLVGADGKIDWPAIGFLDL
jgi:flavin reductase (DIM6/NTAB) family NADH-FMN oxidoreductase RutF